MIKEVKDVPWPVWVYFLIEYNNSICHILDSLDKLRNILGKDKDTENYQRFIDGIVVRLKEDSHNAISFTQGIVMSFNDKEREIE